MFFLHTISKAKEIDDDFFVNVIKLVLCALSMKLFPEDDIKNKVSSGLENFVFQFSHQIFQSRQFSALNQNPMKKEIKVHHTYNECMYV